MDESKYKELRELIELLKANEIAEFEMEKPDLKVRVKFGGAQGVNIAELARVMAAAPESLPVVTTPAAVAHIHAHEHAVPEEKHHLVKSPIVGTFYESPSPGSPPFVKVGDMVEVGQVLCIVEAMKLMNEIESDVAGEIVERIAVAGQPVEYGQSLFSIKVR